MTHQENRQRVKNEALNKLRKLFNPNTEHNYTYYSGEGSTMEQVAYDAQYIIEELEKQLSELP